VRRRVRGPRPARPGGGRARWGGSRRARPREVIGRRFSARDGAASPLSRQRAGRFPDRFFSFLPLGADRDGGGGRDDRRGSAFFRRTACPGRGPAGPARSRCLRRAGGAAVGRWGRAPTSRSSSSAANGLLHSNSPWPSLHYSTGSGGGLSGSQRAPARLLLRKHWTGPSVDAEA
jgi:hypothetical protein